MSESLLDVRELPKDEAYALVHAHLTELLHDNSDVITTMATVSAVLYHGFGFLWTGFYRVVSESLLRVGPYQGTVGCLEIAIGRGVCGTAAAEGRTVIVADVSRFPGHIACDARARSEIVVPVYDAAGLLVAVLDVDSERVNAFDEQDRAGLERLVSWFARPELGNRPEARALAGRVVLPEHR
jgi:L-methionine (R)-S-oxide reductase